MATAKGKNMRNILFITADQWRGDCLSLLGHRVRTPNLDALANESVVFKKHYANAVPCGPSRACLHTSMYLQNHRSGTNGTPLDARHTNWAKELKKINIEPALFGYTDTSHDPREFNIDHKNLKSYEGILPGMKPVLQMGTEPHAWAYWLKEKGVEIPDQHFKLYTNKLDGADYEDGGATPLALSLPKELNDTPFMVEKVIDYISEQKKSWCVHLSLLRPHPPWIAPEPFNRMYPPVELMEFNRREKKVDEASQHPFLEEFLNKIGYQAPEDDKKLARLKASYFGLMSEVDQNLGVLFDYLKNNDFWGNTLVIFTSDHGEQIGDHWLLGKLGYFDESYHIPLIIRDPTNPQSNGRIIEEFTENVDVMPTILDWVDLPLPVQCDGRSLSPFLKNQKTPSDWRDAVHWEYDFRDIVDGSAMEKSLGLTHHQCTLNVLRDDACKYVHFTNLPPLFFDLKNDPGEFVDQSRNPEYTSEVLHYAQKMLSWRMNHDEQTLTHIKLTKDGPAYRESPRY